MNQPWTSWMLAGALAASLAWNFRHSDAPAAPASCTMSDFSDLGLSDEQRRELERWFTTSCDDSCRAEAAATAKLDELRAALRDPGLDPDELRSMAAEVSRLRTAALAACVESIVGVRRVLSHEQLELLLDRCCSEGSCAK